MYYTTNQVQNASADFEKSLVIPSMLTDFVNTSTSVEATKGGKEAYWFHEDLDFDINNYRCPDCNCRTHIHTKYPVRLRHLCFGGRVSFVMLDKHRFICPECACAFKSDGYPWGTADTADRCCNIDCAIVSVLWHGIGLCDTFYRMQRPHEPCAGHSYPANAGVGSVDQ